MGGLHIIGTERHESRRIDNQLRGRAGRQGDPGSSRFFLSLEDDLMRKFAGEWVSAVLTRLGMQEGEAIESKMVSRRIEGAQKKVEERNFDIRKNLLEYDEVMDQQRRRIYSFRQSLLEGAPPKEMILEMVDKPDRGCRAAASSPTTTARPRSPKSVGQALGVELTARDIKGASFEDAQEIARSKAERQLSETIRQAIDENLPPDAEQSEWTWQALANWANNAIRPEHSRKKTCGKSRSPMKTSFARATTTSRNSSPSKPPSRSRRSTSPRRTSSSSPTGEDERSPAGSITSSLW